MAKQLHDIDLLLFCITLLYTCGISSESAMAELNSAVFIFGDSLLDVGTNNYVNGSTATANNPYYGIDYPNSTSTGRFSNGYNTADCIVSQLGGSKESPPPFLALIQDKESFESNILRGVNFASGGSGIFYDTGHRAFTKVIPWTQQIQQFETVCGNITELLGANQAGILISNALYIISVGSNDLLDYYRFPQTISGPDLIANLSNAFAIKLRILHDLGARKFGIIGVPPVGCCPAILGLDGGVCNETLNDLAQAFHESTLTLLQNFSSANPGMQYSLGNSYFMTKLIIDYPSTAGFKDAANACCGQGPNKGQGKCMPTSDLCTNRDSYLFFDLFHPTQRASSIAAWFLVNGGNQFVTPINFTTLANIQVSKVDVHIKNPATSNISFHKQ